MKEGDPTKKDNPMDHQSDAAEAFYAEQGNTRNVCFVWHDGRRMFLNYTYLISGEYTPVNETISLVFTTHLLVLKGVNMEGLFYDLMQHLAKQVICVDERYNLVGDDHDAMVNDIQLTKNE